MAVFIKGNRWYSDHYIDGQRKRKSIGHIDKLTRTEAEKIHKVIVSEIVLGKYNIKPKKKPVLFDKLCEHYLDWAKSNHKAPERDYAGSKPLLSFFKGKTIDTINLWYVNKYISMRKSQGKKPETINKELGILRRMFNLACQGVLETKIDKNPIEGLRILKVPQLRRRVLKDWEFTRLYEVASPHFKPILLVGYMTGMRRGEIATLKWKNVDLEDRYIHIVEAKNNESRSIPISNVLNETLVELNEKSQSEYVFTTHEGEPYKHKSVWKRAWYTALKKSGIENCRFHDLRHTFTSRLIVDEKEDYATVMALTGHKDIAMLRRYSHTKEQAKKIAIEKLEKHLKITTIDTPLDTSANFEDDQDSNIVELTN